ncbi:meprin A subunit beta-like [Nelusetta ayraudi]|uniref:meprin A subunit beta-like n=1 Tax=Nelusetta ayraudi TaxID=303726 RepID=UPI003F711164
MRGLVYLVVNLAISSAFAGNGENTTIIEVRDSKSIEDINAVLGSEEDDILPPPPMDPAMQRSAINDASHLWMSPIAYVLDKSLEINAKGVILKAMTEFRLKSCIDFKPRNAEKYYLSFVKLGGCFSYVGRWMENGQNISIGSFCDNRFIVEHEILHALAFFHEQSRYDRDDSVTIQFENIQKGREFNFETVPKNQSTDNGVPYDYWSVMHYGKNAFSNGNGSTIVTKDPKFQDIIGQTYGISPKDNLELNRLYKCNSSVIKSLFCDFSNSTMCQMTKCGTRSIGWELVPSVLSGPYTDHTSLPTGNKTSGNGHVGAHFMHVSTVAAGLGDSAWLETPRMMPSGMCHVQCLQFYFFHSGNQTDQLNIWLREFESESDHTGANRLVKQITGNRTTHWKIVHVPLNATKSYQVVFEVRKGNGTSEGGFSIDDINLSGTECPHFTMQLNNFERLLNDSNSADIIKSPQLYSRGGYSYRVGIIFFGSIFGLYVQLLSGKNDANLEWPVPQRQVTFQMMDQQPNLLERMSKARSITSDMSTFGNGSFLWDNPQIIGTPYQDEDGQTSYEGPKIGYVYYSNLEEMKYLSFLKGASAVFTFRFEDLTPLVNGSALPCPKVEQEPVANPPRRDTGVPCSRIPPITTPTTPDDSIISTAPGMMAVPVLVFLLALISFMP